MFYTFLVFFAQLDAGKSLFLLIVSRTNLLILDKPYQIPLFFYACPICMHGKEKEWVSKKIFIGFVTFYKTVRLIQWSFHFSLASNYSLIIRGIFYFISPIIYIYKEPLGCPRGFLGCMKDSIMQIVYKRGDCVKKETLSWILTGLVIAFFLCSFFYFSSDIFAKFISGFWD